MVKHYFLIILLIFSLHQAVALSDETEVPVEQNYKALQRDCREFLEKMKDFNITAEMKTGGYSPQSAAIQSFEEASRTLAQFLPDPIEKNLILCMALRFGGQHFKPSLENATEFVRGFVGYFQDPNRGADLLQLDKHKFLFVTAALSSGAPYIDEKMISHAVEIVKVAPENFKDEFVPEFPLTKEGEALRAVFGKMSQRLKQSNGVLESLPKADRESVFKVFERLKAVVGGSF